MAQADGFELPGDLSYDRKDHLWVRVESAERVRVGLDMLTQKSAGRMRHVALKPLGVQVARKRISGTLEAGKYVVPLRAPVGGTLVETNTQFVEDPSLVNRDPYGDGWFVVLEPANMAEDLKELLHGEAEVQAWLEEELADYRSKGLLKE
ncbi:MAG: glycine cleavage system protein H [Anaerolineae bacterium]